MSAFDPQAHDTTPRSFTPLESGQYLLAVSEAKHSVSQAGNDVLTLSIKVLDGPHEGHEMRFQGYTISPKASWRFAQLCVAIDPAMTAFDVKNQTALNHALLGRPFAGEVTLYEDTYLGKTREKNEVKVHRALNAAELEAMKKKFQAPVDDNIPF